MARVLLADDDAAMRDLVGRALGSEGHAVVVAHDGQDALDKASSANTPFDILVTDVQMPLVDGISLAEQMLGKQPGLRVILMSGLQSEISRADRLKSQTTHFLMKPFTLDQIRSLVRQALK
jgi:two-component system, cell cycle response regulator CpdR